MPKNSYQKWIYAQVYFAWVGFVHYLRKFWPFCKKQGQEQFRQNYFPEGYLPVSFTLRAIAHEPGRCTTCGLCDAACPEALSPMRMLLKSPSPLVGEGRGEGCSSCHACETACPERIPIISYVTLASKTFHPGPSWRQEKSA